MNQLQTHIKWHVYSPSNVCHSFLMRTSRTLIFTSIIAIDTPTTLLRQPPGSKGTPDTRQRGPRLT